MPNVARGPDLVGLVAATAVSVAASVPAAMPPTSMRVVVLIDRSSDTGNFLVQDVIEGFVTPEPSPAPTYAGTVTTAPASPLLARPGAVAGHGLDAGVADHYGDPLREQRTALAGAALVDRSHPGVVREAGGGGPAGVLSL